MDAASPQRNREFQKNGPSVGLTESWDAKEIRKENKMKPNWRNVMTRLYAVAALTSMLMGATLNAAAAGPAPTSIKNVVLVHGAFADGSGWEAVAKILEKDDHTVSIAQPPHPSYPPAA